MVGQTEVKWKTDCVWVSACSLIFVPCIALEVVSDCIDKDCSYVESEENIEQPELGRLSGLILCLWNK